MLFKTYTQCISIVPVLSSAAIKYSLAKSVTCLLKGRRNIAFIFLRLLTTWLLYQVTIYSHCKRNGQATQVERRVERRPVRRMEWRMERRTVNLFSDSMCVSRRFERRESMSPCASLKRFHFLVSNATLQLQKVSRIAFPYTVPYAVPPVWVALK